MRLSTEDIALLTFSSSAGGGIYRSKVDVGTLESVLSTHSDTMFEWWISALEQAHRGYTILANHEAPDVRPLP